MWHWLISRIPFVNLRSFCMENSNTVDELAICRIFTENSWLQPFPISLKCSILQLSWNPSIVYPPQNVHNGQAEYGFLFGESHGIKGCVIVGSNVMTWSKIQVLKKSHCTQQCKNTLRDTWKKITRKQIFIHWNTYLTPGIF